MSAYLSVCLTLRLSACLHLIAVCLYVVVVVVVVVAVVVMVVVVVLRLITLNTIDKDKEDQYYV